MINLEHTADENPAIDRNFDFLRSFVMNTGDLEVGIRFGVATDTWPGASQISTGVAVAHGLGTTPKVVFCQSQTVVAHARPTTVGATTFNINHRTVDGSSPAIGNAPAYWLVIG